MNNKMHEQAIKRNCTALQQQQEEQQPQRENHQQQHQKPFSNCIRRKSRKKRKKSKSNASMPAIVETTYTTTTKTIANNSNYYNSYKVNILLIITLLLITMAADAICQNGAAAVAIQKSPTPLTALLKSAATSLSSASSSSSLLSSASLSPTQQQYQQKQERQLQQKHLFAMLTNNRPAVAAVTTTTSASGAHELYEPAAIVIDGADDDDDDDDNLDMNVAATSLETTGFVADDGQQYEKAEKALAGGASSLLANADNNNQQQNANNCPKECKCLNDYFDCGKQHLDRTPALPNYVQILDLVGNKLNDTTVLEIKNLPELQKLSLKRNQLESVPTFIGLVALKQLNLANNRIQRITSEALVALPKLKVLDLSRNYLHTIESNYFPATNRLAHLILNSNEIANIDENAFVHLSDLLDMELNNNRLVTLPAGVFKNLNKLKKLSLNYNHLEINWSTFKGLHALQKLFLKSNNIRALQDGVFHVMRSIETIELDHNGITSLSRQGLFNLTKLHHLSLSNNSITRIVPDTWEFTQSLISLDLSHNNISDFKPQHLDCLQRLRHLNLGHNKIQYLVDSTFECVKNLEDLNLRRNKLAWIIEDQGAAPPFKALRKLKKLDLYGNNLKQINSKSLSGLTSLDTLNLGGNALATIQSGAFDQMLHLQKLSFKSLNFICDCDLLWFRRWLQKNSQTNGQMQSNAVCGYPEHLLDRELLSLTPAELICADTPKPIITREPSNQLAVKGANITMECMANSPAAASLAAADELKIKWRHDNQNVRDRNERMGSSSHHHHAGGGMNSASYSNTETLIRHDQSTNQTTIIGYLRLYNVSYESAGKYQCVVSNAFGTTYSQKFKISIGIHPSFLQIPSNLTIDSGGTARLICSATGDPMPEIALQKFGASDFPAATERRLQVIREENAFVIINAKPIDTGIYTFTAESAAGEIRINASLIVNDKPQPAIPLVSKEIVLGESSVLECLNEMAADLIQPHREWFKDNKPFHTSSTSASERYYFTVEKELLIIVNTQSMDAGHYRCEITDNSKTFTLQTQLIVVQENFSAEETLIFFVALVVGCLVVGTLIICVILCYNNRKLQRISGRGGSNGRSAVGLNANSQHALDQTQLTTLNRTYLQQQRSLADLDMHLNGNGGAGIGADDAEQHNCLIVTATPNYQQLLLQRGGGLNRLDEGLTLEYDNEHNQDHLSSKDSGTGSDAAVKRSIDDFTLTMLPAASDEPIASTPTRRCKSRMGGRHAALAKPDTCTDDDDDDDDDDDGDDECDDREDVDFATSRAMGVSQYDVEMCELGANGERERFLQNNNYSPTSSETNFDGGVGVRAIDRLRLPPPPLPLPLPAASKCKINLSTNFNTNPATQAVDI